MANNFQRGDLTGVSWLGVGQGGFFVATVHDQDLDVESLLWDCTTTLAGGVRARLAMLQDASAEIVCVYDADNSPYLAFPNIVQGAGGLMLFAITTLGRSIQLPMRIQKVHWKSNIETGVMYNFSAKCDSRVGAIVYPAA